MSTVKADKAIISSLGPLRGDMICISSAVLGTVVTQITLPTIPQGGAYRVKLAVGTVNMAYMVVPKGNGAPAFTADFAAGTCGSMVLASTMESFSLPDNKDLYVVGASASTQFNFTFVLE